MKKRPRLIHLSEPIDAWLRVAAAKDGISVSELVRRVLDKERKKRGVP